MNEIDNDVYENKFDTYEEENDKVEENKNQFAQNINTVSTAWELSIWKKSEQSKFLAYLKQVELEHINKISDEFKSKEEKREKEYKILQQELNGLINKTRKKLIEVENRENKIVLIEEEIKLKLNDISRQIILKDEEIYLSKKNQQEEKLKNDKETKKLKEQLILKENQILDLENSIKIFKKEVEDSSFSNIRKELDIKNYKLEEIEKENNKLNQDNIKLAKKIGQLNEEIKRMKIKFDEEKEQMYKNKVDEIEKLRFELTNQKEKIYEMNELNYMKEMIVNMKDKKKPEKTYKVVSIEQQYNTNNSKLYENELERLSNYRSIALSTGYKESDKMIQDIDRQIIAIKMKENI